MKEMNELYTRMGISPEVYAYGEKAIARLRERFDAIDQIAEYTRPKFWKLSGKTGYLPPASPLPTAMPTMTKAATSWSRAMRLWSTRRPPWSGPTSPAVPMP